MLQFTCNDDWDFFWDFSGIFKHCVFRWNNQTPSFPRYFRTKDLREQPKLPFALPFIPSIFYNPLSHAIEKTWDSAPSTNIYLFYLFNLSQLLNVLLSILQVKADWQTCSSICIQIHLSDSICILWDLELCYKKYFQGNCPGNFICT